MLSRARNSSSRMVVAHCIVLLAAAHDCAWSSFSSEVHAKGMGHNFTMCLTSRFLLRCLRSYLSLSVALSLPYSIALPFLYGAISLASCLPDRFLARSMCSSSCFFYVARSLWLFMYRCLRFVACLAPSYFVVFLSLFARQANVSIRYVQKFTPRSSVVVWHTFFLSLCSSPCASRLGLD